MQVHDNLGFKFRSSHYNSAGTVKGDKLCMDASETRVVVGIHLNPKLRTDSILHISLTQVGGTTSQKVWVFTLEEEDPSSQGIVTDLLVKMTRPRLFLKTNFLNYHLRKAGHGH